jgi:hypothetical protein
VLEGDVADLLIRDERIAWRLLDIAQRENRSVESVLDTLLDYYPTVQPEETAQETPFAMWAKAAEDANIHSSGPVDTSERSREILNTEYADYLKRRLNEQSDTD